MSGMTMSRSIGMATVARRALGAVVFGAFLGFDASQDARAHPEMWSTAGPRAAYVNALAIDPRKPRILYAGTGVGVYKSTDQGRSWSRARAGLPSAWVSALAIDPRTPTTVYAGTWGAGVFKSTDGGDTWRAINQGLGKDDFLSRLVAALAIDARSPETLYAGTTAVPGLCCGRVFRSTDGGETWSLASGGLPFMELVDLVIDPRTPSTLYAAGLGWDTNTTGVFRSLDGGATWQAASRGLPSRDGSVRYPPPPIWSLAIDPREPTTLFAGTIHGIFKSTDGADTWRMASTGLPHVSYGRYSGASDLVVDPRSPTTVYASVTTEGPYKSTDAGASWFPIHDGTIPLPIDDVLLDPEAPDTLYVVSGAAGGRAGVFRSTDGGGHWSKVSQGIVASSVHVLVVDPLNPGTVYAGMGGQVPGVYKSTDWGGSWGPTDFKRWNVEALAIDPQRPATVYAGTWGGHLLRSTDGGGTWTDLEWPYGDILAIAVHPRTSGTLYVSAWNVGLAKSTDGGATWTRLPAGGVTLAIDPRNPETVYAGTFSSGVFKTTNGGLTWHASTTGLTHDLGEEGFRQHPQMIYSLAIDPQTPTTLYVGAAPYFGDPPRSDDGGVFRSDDGGASWRPVNRGLDTTKRRFVHAVLVDPRNTAVLYAATLDGVFRSTNGGASWSPLGVGLEGLPVGALALDPSPPGALYTTGGGVNVLSPAPVPIEAVGPADAGGARMTASPED